MCTCDRGSLSWLGVVTDFHFRPSLQHEVRGGSSAGSLCRTTWEREGASHCLVAGKDNHSRGECMNRNLATHAREMWLPCNSLQLLWMSSPLWWHWMDLTYPQSCLRTRMWIKIYYVSTNCLCSIDVLMQSERDFYMYYPPRKVVCLLSDGSSTRPISLTKGMQSTMIAS